VRASAEFSVCMYAYLIQCVSVCMLCAHMHASLSVCVYAGMHAGGILGCKEKQTRKRF
jgi:hypothetical protein